MSLVSTLRKGAAQNWMLGLFRTLPRFASSMKLEQNQGSARHTSAAAMIRGLTSIRLSSTTPNYSEVIEKSGSMAASAGYKSEELLDVAAGTDTSTVSRWAEDAAQYTQDIQSMGEIAAAGLGGYSPVGLLQQTFEFLHVSTGLPWWATIAVTGLAIRILMYPLVIKAQQNSARLSNISPEMENISRKMREANMSGNTMSAGMEMARLQALFESNNVSLARNFLPLAQAPVFISFFIALRQMARVPIESMKTGGFLWFTDLTVSDPYFLLPLISVSTMLLVMEVGAEGGVNVERLQKMKWVFRGLAVITFPIMIKMPTVSLVNWTDSQGLQPVSWTTRKRQTVRQRQIDKQTGRQTERQKETGTQLFVDGRLVTKTCTNSRHLSSPISFCHFRPYLCIG